MTPHRRLESQTLDLVVGHHALKLTLARDASGRLHEIAFVGRGKSGQALDQMFVELGIQVSRAIQGRDPETGEGL